MAARHEASKSATGHLYACSMQLLPDLAGNIDMGLLLPGTLDPNQALSCSPLLTYGPSTSGCRHLLLNVGVSVNAQRQPAQAIIEDITHHDEVKDGRW